MGPASFPRAVRLLQPAEFSHVFQNGTRSSDACFVVLACGSDAATARLGLAVAKKAVAQAVVRNRIKRTVRESFRAWRVNLPAMDIVVQARAAAGHRENAELHASLDWHWREVIKRCRAS
ncbi:MAG TPA: ribonuclease P protein component [Gammaproteobacteria bacterium]|nr:ribonuclease P protein component [Gammaproteobacteria bacterium]